MFKGDIPEASRPGILHGLIYESASHFDAYTFSINVDVQVSDAGQEAYGVSFWEEWKLY